MTDPRLRLRVGGELAGWYPLRPGTTTVGSRSDNDVVLQLQGVSRHHASIDAVGGRPWLQDLGSKNGTFLNGLRVERAPLAEGDEIRFGPVVATVERLAPEDAALAIAPDHQPRPVAADDGETCTRDSSAHESPSAWLDLVNQVAAMVLEEGKGELGAAMALLARSLGASSTACLRWDGAGRPTVVAAWGDPLDLAGVERGRALLEGVVALGRDEEVLCSDLIATDPGLVAAVAAGPGTELLGVVVEGGGRLGDVGRPLVELALRLMRAAWRVPHDSPRKHRAQRGDLVFPAGYVVGSSTAAAALHERLRHLAASDLPVLLVGETGVGKELAARTLHASSRRRGGPFVALNCAAIPAELLEAELFGIEAGVATGVARRSGKLVEADGGTLLLDEIGDMSGPLQAKLLRALQENEVEPVGGRAPRRVDIRVVAATNGDLEQRIAAGAFRADLYYRVAGAVVTIPPLRERRADIPLLVEHFLAASAHDVERPNPGMTVGAMRRLLDASWPGNVRQLAHEVRRLLAECPDGLPVDSTMISEAVASPLGLSPATLPERVEELERRLIAEALAAAHGNRSAAARALGLSRNGLLKKMTRYRLDN